MAGIFRQFFRDQNGNIAVIASLMLLPVLMLAGAGIDYGRVATARGSLQSSVDLAAISAIEKGGSLLQYEQSIEADIEANYGGENVDIRVRMHEDQVRVTAKDVINTPMLHIIGRGETKISVITDVGQKKFSSSVSLADGIKAASEGLTEDQARNLKRKTVKRIEAAMRRMQKQTRGLSYDQRMHIERILRNQLKELR